MRFVNKLIARNPLVKIQCFSHWNCEAYWVIKDNRKSSGKQWIRAVYTLVRQQRLDEVVEFFLMKRVVNMQGSNTAVQINRNGTFTSIGHACFATKKDFEEYMVIMVHGRDPLPIGGGASPVQQAITHKRAMWKLPDNWKVRWSQYRCKNFTCLARALLTSTTRKGFF